MGIGQSYSTVTPRIGKFRGEILKHAVPKMVLGITGKQFEIPENMSDTVVYRRWLPFGGASTNATTINQWSVSEQTHITQEGVTPSPDTIAPQDISVTLKQYICLYMYTDKTADMYEDDVPAEMKKQTGERMGLLKEKIHYGALKGCTNRFYAGGTSRATVDATISIPFLRKITASLMKNRASLVTEILKPSVNYGTSSVEGGFLVFANTDMENDIRNLPGFTKVADYGSMKPMHALELGAVDRYRFIISPELDAIPDAGAAVGSTGLFSTTGSNIDIYPTIVVAADAWGDVALRGVHSFTEINVPVNKQDSGDPAGQRGYVGAKFYAASFVQNDGWMAVAEIGQTDLTGV